MLCTSCGRAIEGKANYCPSCGSTLLQSGKRNISGTRSDMAEYRTPGAVRGLLILFGGGMAALFSVIALIYSSAAMLKFSEAGGPVGLSEAISYVLGALHSLMFLSFGASILLTLVIILAFLQYSSEKNAKPRSS